MSIHMRVRELDLRFEGDKSIDGLTCQFICSSDYSCLCYALVEDESGFDFSGRETMARDVDDICKKEEYVNT